MPLRWKGRFRKRWRWVGAFSEPVVAFAAVIEIGPARMAFWGVWDREHRELRERTRRELPWRRAEVELRGSQLGVASGDVRVTLRFGEGAAIESICPNGEGGYTWTRKLAGVPARGEVEIGDRRIPLEGRGVIDDSAGYHRRHTGWSWSAGVGSARDGRPLAWNLVSGINDPPRHSERAVWLDGRPMEPQPIVFEGLDAVRFADGSLLEFEAEAERRHSERLPLIAHSEYRAPVGSFRGTVGGVELSQGLGVMERHDVVW